MAIVTITAQFPRKRIPEGTQASLTARFYDNSYTLTAPTTAKYRIDNPENCQNLTDWVTLSPASSIAIIVDGTTQRLNDQGETEERRRITVMADAGLTTQTVKSYDWIIVNAFGVA